MPTVNSLFGELLERVLTPLDRVTPTASITAVSVVVAVGMLFAVKATSDQNRLTAIKRRLQASLFEIRLFNDDPRTVIRAQAAVFQSLVTYLALTVVPLLWTILPLIFIAAHLQSRYGYQGLEVGRAALVKVYIRPGADVSARAVILDVPPGVRIETPQVWMPAERQVAWRIAADREGDYILDVVYDGARLTKTLKVSSRIGRRSPVRTDLSILKQLIYPSEQPLPADAPISTIEIAYPEGSVSLARWHVHWSTLFLAVSIGTAQAFKRRLGVTF